VPFERLLCHGESKSARSCRTRVERQQLIAHSSPQWHVGRWSSSRHHAVGAAGIECAFRWLISAIRPSQSNQRPRSTPVRSFTTVACRGIEYVQCVLPLLIEIFPSIGAIEPALSSRCKNVRRHQSSVHAHTISRLSCRCPVRHAAAVPTTMELNGFVAPQIAFRCTLLCNNAHMRRRVVGPQNAIAPTDGAIAFRDVYRRVPNLQFHCTAMARRFDHDSPRRYLNCWF
jgi:hypothetical protein